VCVQTLCLFFSVAAAGDSQQKSGEQHESMTSSRAGSSVPFSVARSSSADLSIRIDCKQHFLSGKIYWWDWHIL
jgi:hypothetical protein